MVPASASISACTPRGMVRFWLTWPIMAPENAGFAVGNKVLLEYVMQREPAVPAGRDVAIGEAAEDHARCLLEDSGKRQLGEHAVAAIDVLVGFLKKHYCPGGVGEIRRAGQRRKQASGCRPRAVPAPGPGRSDRSCSRALQGYPA